MFRHILLYLLLITWAAVGSAQNRVSFVRPTCAPGRCTIADYIAANEQPDLTLAPQPGARAGKVWLRRTDRELVVIGKMDGPAPSFPRESAHLLSGEHIEVWLAAAPELAMPPIGWGNQFGEEDVSGEDGCKKWANSEGPGTGRNPDGEKACTAWVANQKHYRAQFKRLFVRQWMLTDKLAEETFAAAAYREIAMKYATATKLTQFLSPEILAPKPGVSMRLDTACCQTGYGFMVTIPYRAFPPLRDLDLRELWVMVSVFNSAAAGKRMGPYSTTAPDSRYGNPATFNRVQLDPPPHFTITPCEYPLAEKNDDGKPLPVWFLPGDNPADPLKDTFTVVNYAGGYLYDPDGLSPIANVAPHYWKSAGPGETVCGPKLSYNRSGMIKHYEPDIEVDFGVKHFGSLLVIKDGPGATPLSRFGSGQCGACPVSYMTVLGIDDQFHLTQLLDLGGDVVGGRTEDQRDIEGIDYSVSPDWLKITKYSLLSPPHPLGSAPPASEENVWSSVTYCWRGGKYEKCGEKDHATPPDPPTVKDLRSLE